MKTNLKKISLALGALIIIGSMFFILKKICSNHSLNHKSSMNYYNDIAYFNNGKVCLMSKSDGKCLSKRVDVINYQYNDDSLLIFKDHEKYGYMSSITGEIIIPANKFDRVYEFDNESGLAAVVENNKMGFINKTGSYIINPQYDYDEFYYQQSECEPIFNNGFCYIFDEKTGNIGVINTQNKIILAFEYDWIEWDSDGYIKITKDGYEGLTDESYNILFEPIYQSIEVTIQGFIISEEEPFRRYLMDFDRKTIITENVFDEVEKIYEKKLIKEYYYEDAEYELTESGFSRFSYDYNYGVIDDKTGKIIIPPLWDMVEYHSKGLFKALLRDNYFILDTKGNIIN